MPLPARRAAHARAAPCRECATLPLPSPPHAPRPVTRAVLRRFSPGLGRVVRRLLDQADFLYARADAGVSMLPRSCRTAIYAARLIYAEIGAKLVRRGSEPAPAPARARAPAPVHAPAPAYARQC